MEELSLKTFVSIIKKSTQGQILKAHVGPATRGRCFRFTLEITLSYSTQCRPVRIKCVLKYMKIIKTKFYMCVKFLQFLSVLSHNFNEIWPWMIWLLLEKSAWTATVNISKIILVKCLNQLKIHVKYLPRVPNKRAARLFIFNPIFRPTCSYSEQQVY